jgi:alpha-1,2-mannosyltransferase
LNRDSIRFHGRYIRIETSRRQLFSALRQTTSRKRLWLAGSGLALVLLTIIVGNQFIAQDKAVTRQMLGHDFLAFYTAGSFIRDGRYHDLYKLDAVKDFEQSTAHAADLEVGKSFGPWWNPPFYAMMFEPFAALPYPNALNLWREICLVALAIAIVLLMQMVAGSARNWGLVPLLVLTSMPFIQALSHGQNTFTSLLLLTATVAAWRSERRLAAGLLCGLLFYKPQLGAVVAAVLVLDLGWSAFAGLCVTGAVLAAVCLIALPGSLHDYMRLLPANVHWMQVENSYLWERHVTLKAFWRLLLQGREAGEPFVITQILIWLSVTAVVGGLAWAIVRSRGEKDIRRDRLIAATITAMPLIMPFYFDYDLLLLAVPVTLYAVDRLRQPASPGDVWLTRGWVVLFFWMFVNPAIGMHTHVNVTVILLSTIAAMQIRRAGQREVMAQPLPMEQPRNLPLAA